ncbi:MAG: hypothetical protein PHR90_06735 [Sphaerochaetaceae bacterium]|nr:hypothetical protein [Sphaerochaetaceae bacterium]
MVLKEGLYMNEGMKWCKGCNKFVPVTGFYAAAHNKGGLMTLCKRCHLAKYKAKKKDIPVPQYSRSPRLEDALL